MELTLAQGSCQVTPSENAADPPDLKTAKDQGDQTQLDVSPVQVDLASKVVTALDCGIGDLLKVVTPRYFDPTTYSSSLFLAFQ